MTEPGNVVEDTSHDHPFADIDHPHDEYAKSSELSNYAKKHNHPYARVHNHPYASNVHNHDSDYFPYSQVENKIKSQVNSKWENTQIDEYEKAAKDSKDRTIGYENAAKASKELIVDTYEPAALEAKEEAERLRDDAKIASEASKLAYESIIDDYKNILELAKKSQVLAEIIGHLAESSKVLNSAVIASTNIANTPFNLSASENGNGEKVAKAIADAIKNPIDKVGHFSYSGYTTNDYKNDLASITTIRQGISPETLTITDNYVEFRNNIANKNDEQKNYQETTYSDQALSGVTSILPPNLESLGLERFTNMKSNVEGFLSLNDLCGVDRNNLYTKLSIPATGAWKMEEGDRIRMCDAYHNTSESNENILELEELLSKKKNLASDVMLNYILNEDNNNESTIKQAYDKINDENNLKIRQIKNKEYTNKKNIDNLKILKFAILLFLISVPFLILNKKEIISINLLLFVISILIVIFIIFSGTIIYKQLSADKFNYNKINRTIDNINTIKKINSNKDTENTFNRNKSRFSSFFGCFNSDCCEDGTVYDESLKKCILPNS